MFTWIFKSLCGLLLQFGDFISASHVSLHKQTRVSGVWRKRHSMETCPISRRTDVRFLCSLWSPNLCFINCDQPFKGKYCFYWTTFIFTVRFRLVTQNITNKWCILQHQADQQLIELPPTVNQLQLKTLKSEFHLLSQNSDLNRWNLIWILMSVFIIFLFCRLIPGFISKRSPSHPVTAVCSSCRAVDSKVADRVFLSEYDHAASRWRGKPGWCHNSYNIRFQRWGSSARL